MNESSKENDHRQETWAIHSFIHSSTVKAFEQLFDDEYLRRMKLVELNE